MYLPWSFQENHLLPRVYLALEQSSLICPLFFSTRTQRSPYLMLASVFWVEVTRLSQNESSWVKLSQCWVTSWVNVESNKSWVWASSVSELRLQDWVTREAKECSRSFLHMKYKCQSINPKVYVPYKYIFPIIIVAKLGGSGGSAAPAVFLVS